MADRVRNRMYRKTGDGKTHRIIIMNTPATGCNG
jgi:hypothetical protein